VKQALKQLLNALDEISKTHAEVSDPGNREAMTKAIYQGFVLRKDSYKLPARFGMLSTEGNRLVREAPAIGNSSGGVCWYRWSSSAKSHSNTSATRSRTASPVAQSWHSALRNVTNGSGTGKPKVLVRLSRVNGGAGNSTIIVSDPPKLAE
jgi:hypothetical protein